MDDNLLSAIRETVRDAVNESTMRRLESAAGGVNGNRDRATGDWYAQLPEDGKSHVQRILQDAVDETIFGVLGVVDDMQSFDHVATGEDAPEGKEPQEVCLVVDSAAESLV